MAGTLTPGQQKKRHDPPGSWRLRVVALCCNRAPARRARRAIPIPIVVSGAIRAVPGAPCLGIVQDIGQRQGRITAAACASGGFCRFDADSICYSFLPHDYFLILAAFPRLHGWPGVWLWLLLANVQVLPVPRL